MRPSPRRPTRWLVPLLVVAVLAGTAGSAAVALASGSSRTERSAGPARTWQGPANGVQVLGGAVRPGLPTLQRFGAGPGTVTVTVAPARPGPNLVRLDAVQGWDTLLVGTDRQHLTAAVRRPGTAGRWAEIDLVPGTNTVYVAHGPGPTVALTVEAGADGGPAAPDLAGGDGPECLASTTGRIVAGSVTRVASCPAQTLTAGDKATLLRAVATILVPGVTRLAVQSDLSTRSQLALRYVRRVARQHGTRVVAPARAAEPRTPLVLVAGWQESTRLLASLTRSPGGGILLAPWLQTPGVVATVPGPGGSGH